MSWAGSFSLLLILGGGGGAESSGPRSQPDIMYFYSGFPSAFRLFSHVSVIHPKSFEADTLPRRAGHMTVDQNGRQPQQQQKQRRDGSGSSSRSKNSTQNIIR